jgi:hypothetical protein
MATETVKGPSFYKRFVSGLGWVGRNPIPALTLFGLLLYASLRLGAGIFYGRLGFNPEEVGLGYAEILAKAAYGLLLFVALNVLIMLVYWPLGRWIASMWIRPRGRPPLKTKRGKSLERATPWVLSVVLVLMVSTPVAGGFGQASQVEQGVVNPPYVQLVWWDTRAAEIQTAEGSAVNLPEGCLIYLGQANGFAAIYDPRTDTSWRVPTGSIAIQTGGELADVSVVPDDCPTR